MIVERGKCVKKATVCVCETGMVLKDSTLYIAHINIADKINRIPRM